MNYNLFLDNAYSVLGLDSDASEKEIVQRGREIGKILEIGEVPSYDNDFLFSSERRNKKNIERANRRLLDPKNEIIDSFFWFESHNSIDRAAIRKCRCGEWREAIGMWNERIANSSNSAKCYPDIRNKAVAESILFEETHTRKWLKTSAEDWKVLIESEGQWELFFKIYKLKNPSIDNRIFDSFQNKAKEIIADFYYKEIEQLDNNKPMLDVLRSAFGTYGATFESEILKPKVDTLRGLVGQVDDRFKESKESNRLNADTWISTIINLRNRIDFAAGAIQEFGDNIWSRSDIEKLRKDCSNSINYLCNSLLHLAEEEKSIDLINAILKFMRLGYDIAPEKSQIENQIHKNIDVIKDNIFYIRYSDELDRIKVLISMGSENAAIKAINNILFNDLSLTDNNKNFLITVRNNITNAAHVADNYYRSSGGGVGRTIWNIIKMLLGGLVIGFIYYSIASYGGCD